MDIPTTLRSCEIAKLARILATFVFVAACRDNTEIFDDGPDAGRSDGGVSDADSPVDVQTDGGPDRDAARPDTGPLLFGCDEEVTFLQEPTLRDEGEGWVVSFEVDGLTDVEVSIVDTAERRTVRHLVAGVLGPNAPAPLVANAMEQQIPWDGLDDEGVAAEATERLSVRVRAGMCSELARMVGGDPYAFFSGDMPINNHTLWQMTGLEVKSDGTVYVMGTAGLMGPMTIRQYSADGEFLRTVFPFPAGLPTEDVEGWGINTNASNSYTPQHTNAGWPGLTTTALRDSTWSYSPKFFPNADPSQLTVRTREFGLLSFGTDGTIDSDPAVRLQQGIIQEPLLVDPAAHRDEDNIRGPVFTRMTPDGSAYYLSGLYKMGSDFYEDGAVWRVDIESGVATRWFSLGSTIDHVPFSYSTLHGVEVDDSGHVFVADRFNNRVLVLDESARFVREIPIMNPDDIVYNAANGALYVTSRHGTDHAPGDVRLHKIDDWRVDTEASEEIFLIDYNFDYLTDNRTRLAVVESEGASNVWVVFKDIPVRIFRDSAEGLALLRDFYESGERQRFLSFNRMSIDRATENVYIAGGFNSLFRLDDWADPVFRRVHLDADTPLLAVGVSVDSTRRFLYTKNDEFSGGGRVHRYDLDDLFAVPRPLEGASEAAVSGFVWSNYNFWSGNSDRGFDVAHNGQVAALSGTERLDFGSKALVFPVPTAENVDDIEPLVGRDFGSVAGGIRFDREGNLYVGVAEGDPVERPVGFEEDGLYTRAIGRVYKFARSGSDDALFTGPLGEPEQIYDTHYGAMWVGGQTGNTPRFGVDAYGRLYLPNSMTQTVTVIDNNGVEILSFGTYGNMDSRGGLPGDLVPTSDIPMAYPISADASDDYIYVADLVNQRLVQVRKHFALDTHEGLTDRLAAP
ncbi:MAG: hypothetical protein ACI9KE_006716 [Polyangiales bacterium]|jgi:hypothetical protein